MVTFFIFHLDPAKIIRRPQNSSIEVGGFSAFFCEAEGNPTPVITWTRDKTNEIIGYGRTIVFCSAQLFDEGWYTCGSKNEVGPGDRASVYLEVTGKNDNLFSAPKLSEPVIPPHV